MKPSCDIVERRLLLIAVRAFLAKYNKFLETRTDEANKSCNTAVEQLRDLVTAIDNGYI